MIRYLVFVSALLTTLNLFCAQPNTENDQYVLKKKVHAIVMHKLLAPHRNAGPSKCLDVALSFPQCPASVIEELLHAKADAYPSAETCATHTPLMKATLAGNLEAMQTLLDYDYNKEHAQKHKNKALACACRTQNPVLVESLLAAKASPTRANKGGISPLLETLQTIQKNTYDKTCLIIQLLVNHGASMEENFKSILYSDYNAKTYLAKHHADLAHKLFPPKPAEKKGEHEKSHERPSRNGLKIKID